MDINDETDLFKPSDKDAWGRTRNKPPIKSQAPIIKGDNLNTKKKSNNGASWIIWFLMLAGIMIYFLYKQQSPSWPIATTANTQVSDDTTASESTTPINTNSLKAQQDKIDSIQTSLEQNTQINRSTSTTSTSNDPSFLDDLEATLNEETFAYAWITYQTITYTVEQPHEISKGQWIGNEYFKPIMSESKSIPHYQSMVYYSGITSFSNWSNDLRYQFLDNSEAQLMTSHSMQKLKIIERQVYTFSSYADASESLDNRKRGAEINSSNY